MLFSIGQHPDLMTTTFTQCFIFNWPESWCLPLYISSSFFFLINLQGAEVAYFHACPCNSIGSSGTESLAAARLTTSLEHSTLIAPMLYLTPSVQPVLHFFLHWISRGAQSCTKARPSDLPTTVGCTDAIGIGSSGATDFSRTRPIQRFFEFFLRVLLCMAFLLHPWDLDMFT